MMIRKSHHFLLWAKLPEFSEHTLILFGLGNFLEIGHSVSFRSKLIEVLLGVVGSVLGVQEVPSCLRCRNSSRPKILNANATGVNTMKNKRSMTSLETVQPIGNMTVIQGGRTSRWREATGATRYR